MGLWSGPQRKHRRPQSGHLPLKGRAIAYGRTKEKPSFESEEMDSVRFGFVLGSIPPWKGIFSICDSPALKGEGDAVALSRAPIGPRPHPLPHYPRTNQKGETSGICAVTPPPAGGELHPRGPQVAFALHSYSAAIRVPVRACTSCDFRTATSRLPTHSATGGVTAFPTA